MRVSILTLSLSLLVLVPLTACSESEPGPGAQTETMEIGEGDSVAIKDAAVASPDNPLFEDETEEASPAVQEALPAQCPDEPGIACSGPIVVRMENVAITRDRQLLTARGTMVVQNRSNDPLSFTLSDDVTMNLDNGARVNVNNKRYDISGITVCRRDAERCFQESPSSFKTLNPGDSPARINITMKDRVESSLLASLPSIETGTATTELYVVDASGSGRQVQIAMPNVPVRNQIAN